MNPTRISVDQTDRYFVLCGYYVRWRGVNGHYTPLIVDGDVQTGNADGVNSAYMGLAEQKG